MVVHHLRKADSEDPFDSVSGSTGLTGAADTTLILTRRGVGCILYGRGRDLEEFETGLEFDGEVLRMRLQVTRTAGARPRDVLEALDLSDLVDEGSILVRTQVQLADEIGSPAMPNKKDSEHEGRNVDQCCPTGRMPDSDC